MDINQAARMIEWLDEERRRDKSMIATLEERMEQQQNIIDTLQKRLNSLESDQTVMRTQNMPGSRDTDLMEQVRREMRQLLESTEAKRLTAEREADRRVQLSQEQVSRPVKELTDKISKIERQTTEMPILQAERDRMMTSVNALQQQVQDLTKKIEEPDRRLAFMEEQRRQDARRISELETQQPEMQKNIDGLRPKVTLLEDLALRIERRVQEVQNSERERREQIQQFIDQQNLLFQQRDQQVDSLVKRFGDQEGAMERNLERFETWAEAYRQMKNIIGDFQRIGERLERRINEVAEMQRLSEERFRQEWNDWRSDDQKRWKQFTLSNDEVWRGHDKDFRTFVEQFNDLAGRMQPLHESIERLWQLERDRAQLYRERYQAMLNEYDKTGMPATTKTTGTMPTVRTDNGSNGTNLP